MFKFILQKKITLHFLRIITGLVFVFSGYVKGIDLAGSAIKFEDYFVAFGMDFLIPVSFPLAIILVSSEFIIGISVLFGLRTVYGTWGILIFMSVFTPLTFFLALFNPVSDCGCFGDAIVLTNWQTFWKNIILVIMTIIVFYYRKQFNQLYSSLAEWSIIIIILILFTGFTVYNYNHLPMIDFRPYNSGTSIPEKMKIPEGAPVDEFETTLIYEKDGVRKEFSLENYPWEDSTWTFVEQRSKLIKEGYSPPIHDFTITDKSGNDITDIVLSNKSYSFLMIAPDLKKADNEAIRKLDTLYIFSKQAGISFYSLTSTLFQELEEIKASQQLSLKFYNTNETTLKTVIRSNPGLLLLKDGVILTKWHYNDLPEIEEINKPVLSSVISEYRKKNERRLAIISFLTILLGISLISINRKGTVSKAKNTMIS